MIRMDHGIRLGDSPMGTLGTSDGIAMLMELQLAGNSAVNRVKGIAGDLKIDWLRPLSEEQQLFTPIHEAWQAAFDTKNQQATLMGVMEALADDKRRAQLETNLAQDLLARGWVRPVVKERRLLGNKTIYEPVPEVTEAVVQRIRAELLEEGPVSDETLVLVTLMEQDSLLKRYFSKHEQQALRARIQALKEDPQSAAVRELLDQISEYTALLLSIVTMLLSI